MEQGHKKFILSNIATLCRFSLSSLKHLGDCAKDEGNDEMHQIYKNLYASFYELGEDIYHISKRNKL